MPEKEAGHILVVDDNEMNRDMLSRRLQRQGYHITLAEHGERALELIQAEEFDLVLLDIMMPRLNGYQVLERVKNDPRLSHIPIVMISAVDDLDSVVKCIELGAEDYLFKPFNPVLLKARVRAGLEKKRANNSTTSSVSPDLIEVTRKLNNVEDKLLELVDDNIETVPDALSLPLRDVLVRIQDVINDLKA